MQVIIRSTKNIDKEFIYTYLPDYIYRLFKRKIDYTRLKAFDDFFDINSFSILEKALKNLLITKNGMYEYNIKLNDLLKSKGVLIRKWIQFITYGNREIKGYPILIEIFKHVSENINSIYQMWEGVI